MVGKICRSGKASFFWALLVFLVYFENADAGCFAPSKTETETDQGVVVDGSDLCAIDGYVTGQIATPGSKMIGNFLQDRTNTMVIDDAAAFPAFDAIVGQLFVAPSPVLRAFWNEQAANSENVKLAQWYRDPDYHAISAFSEGIRDFEVSVYALGLLSDESQNQTSREASSDTTRIASGIGLQFTKPDWEFGIGLDISYEDTNFGNFKNVFDGDTVNAGNSKQNSTEYGLQLFGIRFFHSDYFAFGSVRASITDYDLDRVNLVDSFEDEEGPLTVKTNGDTDGYSAGIFLGGGRAFRVRKNLVLSLSAGVDTEYMTRDGYEESLNGAPQTADDQSVVLDFEDDDSLSVTSIIEARVTTGFDISGIYFLPTLAGRYFHEFADDARDINYSYPTPVASSGITDAENINEVFRTNSPDRNYFHIEAGLGIPLGERLLFELSATKLLGHSFRDEESISAGIRIAF